MGQHARGERMEKAVVVALGLTKADRRREEAAAAALVALEKSE